MDSALEVVKNAYNPVLDFLNKEIESDLRFPLPLRSSLTRGEIKETTPIRPSANIMRFQSIFSPWPHRQSPERLIISCVGMSLEGLKEGVQAGVNTLFRDKVVNQTVLTIPEYLPTVPDGDKLVGIPEPEPYEEPAPAGTQRFSMFVYIAVINTTVEPAQDSQFPILVSARSDLDLCFALRAWSALSITSCKTAQINP